MVNKPSLIREKALGPEDPYLAQTPKICVRRRSTRCRSHTGASTSRTRVVQIQEKVLGPNTWFLLRARLIRAACCKNTGDYAGALGLYEWAVDIQEAAGQESELARFRWQGEGSLVEGSEPTAVLRCINSRSPASPKD